MKKYLCMIMLALIVFFTGCSSQSKGLDSRRDDAEKHFIKKAELTEDQKEILNLVVNTNDIDIFSYEVDESYKTLVTSLELYEKGEEKSIHHESSSQIDTKEGKIAIIIDKDEGYSWRISAQEEGALSSYSFNTENEFEKDKNYQTGTTVLTDPVEIEPDKEIILKAILFSDGDSMSIFNTEYYVEHPEALEEYDHAYLLKCMFSKRDIDEISSDI